MGTLGDTYCHITNHNEIQRLYLYKFCIFRTMMKENTDDSMVPKEDTVQMYSGGIPPSVTLQLASSKKPSGTQPNQQTQQRIDIDKPSYYPPTPEPGLMYSEPEPANMDVKETLSVLIRQNQELMRLLQSRLSEQSRLLNVLMKKVKW